MGIYGCGLSAHCCQSAVAGSIIYVDLWGELSTHLAPQALFTQSSPVYEPLLQAFPFPSTLGEVTLHLLSQVCMFIYSSQGKWVFPPLLWNFPPSTTLTSFPLLVAGRAPLLPLSPARPGLFIYSSVRDSPTPFWCSGHPTLFAMCLYCSYCLLLSFSFIPGWGSVYPGGLCCSGPGLSVGVPRTA
jgi:hypothetical protein